MKNKFLSLIFVFCLVLSLFQLNDLYATTKNDCYLSGLTITEVSDGLEPFDNDNNPGNDANAQNDIVRSFDSIVYNLEYISALRNDTPVDTAKLHVKITLNHPAEKAVFNLDSMKWLESPEIKNEGGQQVLTGYKTLVNTSENNVIPGRGTISVGIDVKAAHNGDKITPNFELWLEGNPSSEIKKASKTTTVTAAPKYNLEIKRSNDTNFLGYYDFNKGTRNLYPTEGVQYGHGRMQAYGIALQLKNDNESKGLKGLEIPTGPISFDLKFKESMSELNDDLVSNPLYKPLFWDSKNNTRLGEKGTLNRDMLFNKNYLTLLCDLMPASHRVEGAEPHNSCENSGNWTFTVDDSDPSLVHVQVDNYSISDFNFPRHRAYYSKEDIYKVYTDNIGCFSTGYFQVLCQFPTEVDTTSNIYLTVEASNIKMNSISGQKGIEVTPEDNKNVNSIALYPPGIITKELRVIEDVGEGHFDFTYKPLSSTYLEGDAAAMKGAWFRIGSPLFYVTDYKVSGLNYLLKFNADAFDISANPNDHKIWNTQLTEYIKEENVKKLYAAKKDKTDWKNGEEQCYTRSDDLIYFKDLAKLHEQGYKCVGILFEVRNDEFYTSAFNLIAACNVKLKLKDNVKINETYGLTSDFEVWEKASDLNDFTYENNPTGKRPTPTNYFYTQQSGDSFGLYIKTEYDKDGNIMENSHQGGCQWGQTILAVDYKSSIKKEIDDLVDGKTPKTAYDIDKNERTVTYKLSPATICSVDNIGNKRDTLIIKDTLPKDLTFISGSAFMGDSKITPQISKNEKGETILTWTLKDVVIGKPLPTIKYKCTIGKAGTNQDVKNNDIINSNASIKGINDKRLILPEFGNYSEVSFSIIKLNAVSIVKRTDTPIVKPGENFNFVLQYANNAENKQVKSDIYDILPYNNDNRKTNYHGSYNVDTISVSFANAPKTFETIKNIFISNDSSLKTNNFSTLTNFKSWTEVTGTKDNGAKTITFTINKPITAFRLPVELEGNEAIQIVLNCSVSGAQEAGDIYVNNFYQYSPSLNVPVISNNAVVQTLGELKVQKTWADNDNLDKIRPESVKVWLYKNGVKTNKSVTLSKANGWKDSFTDLLILEGNTINEFTVKEDPVKGYSTTYKTSGNTCTITNEHTPEATSLTVNKIWRDQNNLTGNRPSSVEVTLIANGKKTSNTKTISESNNWTVTFEGLAKQENGKDIIYTVEEKPIVSQDGRITYKPVYKQNGPKIINIINTISGTRPLVIEKEWNDEKYADICRPPYLNLTLRDSYHEVETFKISDEFATAPNHWKIIREIPLFDENGDIINNISYHVDEYYPGLMDIYTSEENITFTEFKFTDTNKKVHTYKMITNILITNNIIDLPTPPNGYNNRLIVNKLIVNRKDERANKVDFETIKLTDEDPLFKIKLKELKRIPTKNGLTYSGYTGREFNGIVSPQKQLIFDGLIWGKYEICELPSQYFNFVKMQCVRKTQHTLFTEENGKFYVTFKNNQPVREDGEVAVLVTNRIEPFRPYDDAPRGNQNLLKPEDDVNIGFISSYERVDGLLPFELFTPTTQLEPQEGNIPLIISLHGAGDFSASKYTFESHFLVEQFRNWHTSQLRGFNAYIVCPHGVGLSQWNTPNSAKKVDAIIDYMVNNYNVDESKIIIQGHSAGGQGALYMAATRPDRFSAAIIVSGYPCSANVNNIKCPIKGYSGNPTRTDGNGHYIPHEDNDSFDYMATIFDGTPFSSHDWYRLNHTHDEMPVASILLDKNNNGKSDVFEWALAQ